MFTISVDPIIFSIRPFDLRISAVAHAANDGGREYPAELFVAE